MTALSGSPVNFAVVKQVCEYLKELIAAMPSKAGKDESNFFGYSGSCNGRQWSH